MTTAPAPTIAFSPIVIPAMMTAPEPTLAPATGGGSTIQLGAYGSTAKAEVAWGMLASRFPQVSALSKQVVSASVGGKTVVRLRASGSGGAVEAACKALRAGGESCLIVN